MAISVACFILLLTCTNAFQFFLESKSKKCFDEDIPLSAEALLRYTVAQGDGDMTVGIKLIDLKGNVIYGRENTDHDVFSFRALDTIPGVRERKNWAFQDDERDEDDVGYHKAIPDGAGDDRIPYTICFEHISGLHIPRLSIRGSPPRRRIMFDFKTGTDAKTMEDYDRLAKEQHLSSTEKLFSVVEDRVSTVVKLIDEMRQRELRMDHLSGKTTRVVTWYSSVTCLSIAAGALFSSYATYKHLSKDKRF